jgi:hypothetical protein
MILFASGSEGYARVVSSWEIPSPVHVAIEQWMGTWGPSHIPIPMHAQARQPPHIPSRGNEHTLSFPASKQTNEKKKQEKFMRKMRGYTNHPLKQSRMHKLLFYFKRV